MNDLKEIGGFIVSADPFVQHDNSLSGNGTVNSPLGVVPGYNETVLWSGNLSAVNNAKLTATDAPSAYNTVKFIFSPYNDGLRAPTELYFSGCNKEFDLCPIGFMGASIRLNHLRLNFDSNNVGTFSETIQYYISTGANVSSTDRPALLQVIGINRIANN